VIVTDSSGEGQPDALSVVPLGTGEKRRLTNPQPPVLADTDPVLSPDGESLLFLRRTTWASGELHVLPVRKDVTAAGEAKHLAVLNVKPDNATWLANGEEIVLSTSALGGGTGLWRMSVRGGGRAARLPFVGEDGVMPSVSRSAPGKPSRLVYVRSFTDENIWRVDLAAVGASATAPPISAIASTKADIHPQLSPDGRRVAFTSTRSGSWEIWVSDIDGSNAGQITSIKAPTGTGVPRWSPDGQRITFASDAEGQFDIFVVPSIGGKPRNLTSHPALDHVPSFSADGEWIYFSSIRSGQYQIWKVPSGGGKAVQVTKDGGWVSFESPDGSMLYFTPTAAVGAQTPLWRMPKAGGPAAKILENVLNSLFTPLDQGIYYVEQLTDGARLQYFDFAHQQSVTVARSLGDATQTGGFTTSRDGRMVLYARLDSAVADLMLVDDFR
jgi:Tol biopolymer transport system component